MPQVNDLARRDEQSVEQFNGVARACKARREMLQNAFSGNAASYDKAKLISLNRVIFVFATRFIDPAIRPGTSDETAPESQKNIWEFQWYNTFLAAVVAMGMTVQEAIRAGKLTPRDVTTRAPLPPGEPRKWLSLDINSEVRKTNDNFLTGIPQHDAFGPEYPDGIALGPNRVGIDPDNLVAWLEQEKIASSDEARYCLGYTAGEDLKPYPEETLQYSTRNQVLLTATSSRPSGLPTLTDMQDGSKRAEHPLAPIPNRSLSRMAIIKSITEISDEKWRGLFAREKVNKLGECRVSGAGEPTYDPERLAHWIGNKRPELTHAEARKRLLLAQDELQADPPRLPTANNPFPRTR